MNRVKPREATHLSQVWFWSKRWQAEERKVEKDLKTGRVKMSKNVKAFLDDLDK